MQGEIPARHSRRAQLDLQQSKQEQQEQQEQEQEEEERVRLIERCIPTKMDLTNC